MIAIFTLTFVRYCYPNNLILLSLFPIINYVLPIGFQGLIISCQSFFGNLFEQDTIKISFHSVVS